MIHLSGAAEGIAYPAPRATSVIQFPIKTNNLYNSVTLAIDKRKLENQIQVYNLLMVR